jgi:GT2 family glycosyltransferase
MNPGPVTDVVIVNHNSGSALRRCLQTLWQDAANQFNVVLVDNASTDESLQNLPDSEQIKLILNTENVGFARACNQGLGAGRSQWVVFLNPDCFATSSDITALCNELEQHPQAAMIGCRVLNEDGTLQAASRRRLPGFWRIVMHLSGLSRWPMFTGINIAQKDRLDGVIEVEAINGALMLGRRSELEALGGFDEQYPLHFEDLDLFARILSAGKTVLYDDRVAVTHLKGHSKQDSQRIKLWKRQGLCRYLQKHRPAWEARLVSWMLGVK